MKKHIFALLFFLGLSQLHAETLLQIYPLSFSNTLLFFDELKQKEPLTFTLPIEIRQTIVKFSSADLLFAGGLNFMYSEKTLYVKMNSGLTFGYGYHENENYPSFFRNMNITVYPIYMSSLVILYPFKPTFFGEIRNNIWTFAIDVNWEMFQLRPSNSEQRQFLPVSVNFYIRALGLLNKEPSLFVVVPDFGITVGWLLNKVTYN